VSKNVAVFVDVANIFYAAKAAGVDIDYVTLLKSATAGRDLVRAYAYTGLDPDNENQRNFHDFLRRSNYKVVSKDIRKYGDGKVKANLDIELVVDMMKTARNLDIAIVVSGDGDFAPAIRAVQEQGVRVEVISFRGNTSSDLIEVADQFTDIIQLARVEKGTRSGRRVAGDEADLSMTEVPDKQTEGTGAGRGRGGRGRGRGRTSTAEPVATSASRGRGRSRTGATNGAGPAEAEGLVALPGERLSKAVGSLTEADLAAAEVFTLDDLESVAAPDDAGSVTSPREEGDDDAGGRRRRRRGGRGRGRGRGRDEEAAVGRAAAPAREFDEADDEEEEDLPPAPRAPRATPFGSVWDSQLGTSAPPSAASLTPLPDDEDFDEPEIPEYLIAEQRRGARGGRPQGGRGPRGGRSAYQSAIERERYGRGGGGGINRYPDVSGRTGGGDRGRPTREDRAPRRDDRARESMPRGGSSEPWSEVPPELEEMLRAQVSSKAPAAPAQRRESTPDVPATAEPVATPPEDAEAVQAPAPKRRTLRSKAATATADAATADAATADAATAEGAAVGDATAAAPKRRTTRSKAATSASGEAAAADGATATPAAPKRRTTRKPAAATAETPEDADAPAPKRRTTRRSTAASSTESA
jgi:uncharacterized LabA/DUF88 family protein